MLTPGLASIDPTTGLAGTFVGALFWRVLADRIGEKRMLLTRRRRLEELAGA